MDYWIAGFLAGINPLIQQSITPSLKFIFEDTQNFAVVL